MKKLIGISGKIGAGKDTIGAIVQLLAMGKTYANTAHYIEKKEHVNNPAWLQKHSGWENKKYGGKLKEICALLIGCEPRDFESQEFKNQKLGYQWTQVETVRDLLQKVGTDAMRKVVDPQVWVNALFADYTGNNWYISDVRFENEIDPILDRGGEVWRVNRKRYYQLVDGKPIFTHSPYYSDRQEIQVITSLEDIAKYFPEHESETALDKYPFTNVINNDHGVLALVDRVADLFERK